MSARDDGGPAFPSDYTIPNGASVHAEVGRSGPAIGTQRFVNVGLSLRDYFAAKAMQALLSHSPHVFEAAAAWMVADAMLKERAK